MAAVVLVSCNSGSQNKSGRSSVAAVIDRRSYSSSVETVAVKPAVIDRRSYSSSVETVAVKPAVIDRRYRRTLNMRTQPRHDKMRGINMADIRHSIQIAAKPGTIYPLVATASGFRQWWAEDTIESGSAVELGFFNKTTIYRLRLREHRLHLQAEWVCETGDEWNGTRIMFVLEESKAGALLRFTHAGWRSETEYFTSC